MSKEHEYEIKVGLFIITSILLIIIAIFSLGEENKFFQKNYYFTAHFQRVDGLMVGAKVILSGIPVGTVKNIQFDKDNSKIRVLFTLNQDFSELIRHDSTIEIATQGVLGDKYLSISAGSKEQPILPPFSDINYRSSSDFSHVLSQSDELMQSVQKMTETFHRILQHFESHQRSDLFFKNLTKSMNNVAQFSETLNDQIELKTLKTSLQHLDQIIKKIDYGTGTLGLLVNDPSLYDDLKALLGGINRNRIVRNLIRKTVQDGTP